MPVQADRLFLLLSMLYWGTDCGTKAEGCKDQSQSCGLNAFGLVCSQIKCYLLTKEVHSSSSYSASPGLLVTDVPLLFRNILMKVMYWGADLMDQQAGENIYILQTQITKFTIINLSYIYKKIHSGFSRMAVKIDPCSCSSTIAFAGRRAVLLTLQSPVTEISPGWRLIEKSLTFNFVK